MRPNIRSVVVEQHIGIMVAAILTANAIGMLIAKSLQPAAFAISSFYNRHRPPDTFALEIGYLPRMEDVSLIVFGALFQVMVAAGLFYWVKHQRHRTA